MSLASNNILFNSKAMEANKFVVLNADLSHVQNSFLELNSTDNIQTINTTTKSNVNTANSLVYSSLLGTYAPFTKTFIIRGIGYQADIIEEAFTSEFPFSRYLLLRIGHSFLIYKPIPNYIGVKVTKKDRKLVIYGSNKEQVANFSKSIFLLRVPSIYTGRGIRIKKGQHRRKLGKKDIRKGKV
jgi:ribosomal protein L6P/L9E